LNVVITERNVMRDSKIVVIGAGSGIGRAIAIAGAAAGASLVLVGRRREPLDATAELLPRPPSVNVADVTDEAEVIRLFEAIGSFDHLVCTATHAAGGRVTALDAAAVQRAFAAKLWAPLFLAKHGCPRVAQTGSFTFFSGIRSARPTVGTSATSLVNGGLEAFARAMAVELGPVRVNVISPGIVDSGPFWDRLAPDARARMFETYATTAPARRVGTAGDIAAAALAVMANPFMTGTVIPVDGGGVLA
jgi:NAD(P)-dependent dehydrogenase (short-subunit alcohol dehydrogenase family)